MSDQLLNFLLRLPFWAAGLGLMAWAVAMGGWLPVVVTLAGAWVFCWKIEIRRKYR